jgi:hypothetical protein
VERDALRGRGGEPLCEARKKEHSKSPARNHHPFHEKLTRNASIHRRPVRPVHVILPVRRLPAPETGPVAPRPGADAQGGDCADAFKLYRVDLGWEAGRDGRVNQGRVGGGWSGGSHGSSNRWEGRQAGQAGQDDARGQGGPARGGQLRPLLRIGDAGVCFHRARRTPEMLSRSHRASLRRWAGSGVEHGLVCVGGRRVCTTEGGLHTQCWCGRPCCDLVSLISIHFSRSRPSHYLHLASSAHPSLLHNHHPHPLRHHTPPLLHQLPHPHPHPHLDQPPPRQLFQRARQPAHARLAHLLAHQVDAGQVGGGCRARQVQRLDRAAWSGEGSCERGRGRGRGRGGRVGRSAAHASVRAWHLARRPAHTQDKRDANSPHREKGSSTCFPAAPG